VTEDEPSRAELQATVEWLERQFWDLRERIGVAGERRDTALLRELGGRAAVVEATLRRALAQLRGAR
jgi:hypothetical protein